MKVACNCKSFTDNYYNSFHIILILVIFFFVPVISFAAEVDYLEELATEAEDTADMTKKSKTWDEKTVSQFEQMEAQLRDRRPTTYKFYQKLSNKNKEAVLNLYMDQKKISLTSKLIMDLYLKK